MVGADTARLSEATAAIADSSGFKLTSRVWPSSRCRGLGMPHLIAAIVDLAGSPSDLTMVVTLARHYPVVMLGLPNFRLNDRLVRLIGAIAYHDDIAAMVAALGREHQVFAEAPRGIAARIAAWWLLQRRQEPDLAMLLSLTRELAKHSEHLRYNRLLHDHVLQTLEMLSRPESSLDSRARAQVVKDVTWLRSLLDTGAAITSEKRVDIALGRLVSEEYSDRSLQVSFRATDQTWPELSSESVSALCGATREALQNVRKHAKASTAEVVARPTARGVELRIRDGGVGFDPAKVRFGFGLTESITGRLHEAGGLASVNSAMGSGTEVCIFVPATGRPD